MYPHCRSFFRIGILAVLAVMAQTLIGFSAPVKIQVAVLDDITTDDKFAKLIDEFEEANPNISVELLQQYREEFDRLLVQYTGGVAPDIFTGYGVLSGHVVRNELAMDLAPLIKRDKQDALLRDFAPAAMSVMQSDGRIFGFPKYTATGAVYYHKDIWQQAGLPGPNKEWTWEEFYQTAKKLTVSNGSQVIRYGYSLNPSWTWICPWFYAAGVDFSNAKVVPFDSPAAINAGTYLQTLKKQGFMNFAWGGFTSRNAAMTSSGSWELKAQEWINSDLALDVASMPNGPGGKAAQMNNDIVAINRDTKHPEEAWQFLKWFYSRPVQQEYMRIFALAPARMSLGLDWIDVITSHIKARESTPPTALSVFLEATMYARQEPMFSNPQVVNDYVLLAIRKVLSANQPVDTVFRDTARSATAFLAQVRK